MPQSCRIDVTLLLVNCFSSDIHAIVEEVASLNEINLQQTMLTMIQKWLPSASSKQQDADAVCINNNFQISTDLNIQTIKCVVVKLYLIFQ